MDAGSGLAPERGSWFSTGSCRCVGAAAAVAGVWVSEAEGMAAIVSWRHEWLEAAFRDHAFAHRVFSSGVGDHSLTFFAGHVSQKLLGFFGMFAGLQYAGAGYGNQTARIAIGEVVQLGVQLAFLALQGEPVVIVDQHGGHFAITSPSVAGAEGVVWGAGIRLDIGSLLIRPRGRDDVTNADAPGATNQLRLQGIHISDVDGVSPWVLADVTAQPGIFNAVTENGQSFLHLGIGWNTDLDTETRAGTVVVDNITFRNDRPTYMDPMTGAATNTLNLGASSIGSMQIQYLDMKLHAGR